MERYICIHGHFYQPPRENAWLEYVETQDSAYPFHDWNERITAECYGPNAASRILDERGRVAEISNNYAKISFNFGPTLLGWLETNSPDTYRTIIGSDKESLQKFPGHGSAMSQVYNHLIMPLANRRDKITQVIWGIRDFEHRFGRQPEGMWLPETAVDLETLDIMAQQGIKFTIMAPHQAAKVRRIGTRYWRKVPRAAIDPSMTYQVNLPSGRKIALFFYDGPISHAVAFEDVLQNGDNFAKRLASGFSEKRTWPQIVHIATDGETYGHHRRFGDMALAYALRLIDKNKLARLTNYGEYLAMHPPTHEVAINEKTSWSCVHGIERWRSNCGCRIGANPDWNQAWRAPLRAAMDWLRDTLAPKYQKMAANFLNEPWLARDDYIDAILDRSPENVDKFLAEHRRRKLNKTEETTVLKLLELQRHTMLMYASCGWFFDELSGIETVQVMQYAGRAAQLADELFGGSVESGFLERLALARSNLPEHGDGRRIYDKFVRTARVDLPEVAVHLAVSSLFENYGKQAKIYCYNVDLENQKTTDCGDGKLSLGQAGITSAITRETAGYSFGALHSGKYEVNASVGDTLSEKIFQAMVKETAQACKTADFSKVSRLLIKHLSSPTYNINDLLPDERRRLLDRILGKAISELEAACHQVYGHYYPTTGTAGVNAFPPNPRQTTNFLLNSGLRLAFGEEPLPIERIRHLLTDTRGWHTELDTQGLSYLVQRALEKLMGQLAGAPEDAALLKEILAAAEMLPSLPFPVDLWKVQSLYYRMLKTDYPRFKQRREKTGEWLEKFVSLGQHLSMDV